MKINTKIIIQARLGSKRFPQKILQKIDQRSVLEFLIENLLTKFNSSSIVLATTTNKIDKKLIYFKKKYKINFFRGENHNVLLRYLNCAQKFNAENIVRITSDCPLVDPEMISSMLKIFYKNKCDYFSNNCVKSKKRFADGMDIEIFTKKSLLRVYKKARIPSDFEHVTNIYWRNNKNFKLNYFLPDKDLKRFRFSIDYKTDLYAVKKIVKHLNSNKLSYSYKNIINFLIKNKNIKKILDKNLVKFKKNRKDLKN